jgi:hypothetical protein
LLSDPARFESAGDPAAVVLHVDPVAYVATVAVDRQWLALERVKHRQRIQLLGKLERTVGVGELLEQFVVMVGRW